MQHGITVNEADFDNVGKINDVLDKAGLGRHGMQTIWRIMEAMGKEKLYLALAAIKSNHALATAAKQRLLTYLNEPDETPTHAESAAPSRPAPASHPNAPSTDQPPRERSGNREYLGHHVYGSRAALYVEAKPAKGEPDGKGGFLPGRPTIFLEAAGAMDEGKRRGPAKKGETVYDWENKIILQLTETELPIVTAVLTGRLPACEFSSHGPAHDKGFSLQRQERNLYLRINATGVSHAIQITGGDLYAVTSLFLRQMQAASPWMDAQMIQLALDSLVFRPMERPVSNAGSGEAESAGMDAATSAGHCAVCKADLDAKVKNYSINHFGRPLCRQHQKSQRH